MSAPTGTDAEVRAAVAAIGQPILPGALIATSLRALAQMKGGDVHGQIVYLHALGLTDESVAAVLGRGAEVEAYFAARVAGRHVTGGDGVCVVCGARQTAFQRWFGGAAMCPGPPSSGATG